MFSYKFKLSKDEKHSIYATIVLLLVGYLIAAGICEPTMFARFGALAVCVGIIFSMKGLPEIIEAARPRFTDHAQEMRELADKMFVDKGLDSEQRESAHSKLEPLIEEYISGTGKTIDMVKRRLLRIEGTIVVIGTLVWGFGDYLVLEGIQACTGLA
ncbi:hypothetical protein [Marinobacter halophilus]|uniref:Uncharacterized protein n=1 Tax=Marinobacter halophilus TaxID=1323740 RepID=A0A2T1KGT9_9GAMM|nr:hypothetical protein [Marinobacter halophilus]PSF09270.1 hypothetical protein C7H08_04100 [Marinobacter halophilus]GGC79338.1 hypothetical protein GCM10011362_29950 [Marinobacter halophilus]